ncbi:MAG TPA: DUF4157 domain-containing protein [Pyrinomonadaceae bacterium]|nr:DUF4157 domain-containing protein [Pyrinomonadaceae bacterium]
MERQSVTRNHRSAGRSHDRAIVRHSAPSRAPAHPILALQQSIGNQAVGGLLGSSAIQAKLRVNQPGDKFEREADQTADAVMRAPSDAAGPVTPVASISRAVSGSAQRATEEEEPPVQRESRSPLGRPEEESEKPRGPLLQLKEASDEEGLQRQADDKEGEDLQRQEAEQEEGEDLQRQESEAEEPEVAQRKEEEEVAQRKEDEEVAQREEDEEVTQRKEEEEVTQRKGEEEVTQRQEEEEVTQRKEEDEVAQRKEEDEDVQTVQREEAEDDKEAVMPSRVGGGAPSVPRGFASSMRQSSGDGQPVPEETRTFFESRFGADFGSVRIHTGTEATKLNRSIRAKAFTRANHIYFSDGAYDPSSSGGKTLLAHELTHVVQQGHARPSEGSQPASSSPGVHGGVGGGGVLQRQEDEAAPEDQPTEEQKAAALAAAARAEKLAEQAADYGRAEVAKSKQEKAEKKEEEKGSKQKARAEGAQANEAEKKEKKRRKPEERGARAAPPEKTEGEPEAGEARAAEKSPASPEEDPAFQQVVERVGGVARKEKSHAPPHVKAAEAQAAAEAPPEEISGRAQNTHAGEMEKTETPPFDAAAFKAQLLKRIEELTPKSVEEADEFEDNNKLPAVKEQMSGQVAEGKAASRGPLEEKKDEGPDTKSVEPKAVTPIPESAPGGPPPGVGAGGAAPKSKTGAEVETPIQENTQRLGDELSTENITEEQLAKSNEPQFNEALASKQEAETQAAEGPQAYRQFEQAQLSEAEAEAAATASARTKGMHAGRAEAFGQVHEQQGQTKTKDEAARLEVGTHINGIYEKTKTEVERILSELDGKVETAFDEGAEAARKAFEDYVEARMEAYKERRYGGWFGWARWAKDKLFGMPEEVNEFYVSGRNLYLRKMDAVLDTVVSIIGAELAAAKAEIARGRKELADYLAGLPESLKTVGSEASEQVSMLFDSLEENVNNKQSELIDTLANKYNEQLKAVDARIEEMKEANRGLVDKAISAIKAVINTIIELKNLLFRVLAKIADVVMNIIADPIGFLGNMIDAVKLGLDNFGTNIEKHLEAGFITWLTGSLGSVKLQMPDDIFSAKGIFSIIVQVLGLSWDYIRGKAVKLLGEPVVKALEGGFKIFQILSKDGVAGLWEYAQEQFADLKEMVVDQIKNMLITQVIKAGIKWLLSLLNPVAAFIKAAMAIYEIVSFFIQKAKQIMELIEAFIDGIAAVAKGSISAAAKLIEDAFAKAIPLIIGFLASLLGISGLADRVQKLFLSLRKRIDKFIDKILLKAKQAARKLLSKMSPDKRGKVVDNKEQQKHQTIAKNVVSEMQKPPAQGTAYADLRAQKEKQIKTLVDKYGKQLKPPVKLTIRLRPPEEDRKDDDLDFTVRIGPNDEVQEGAVPSKEMDVKAAHDQAIAASRHPSLLKGHGKYTTGHAGKEFSPETFNEVDKIGYETFDHSNPNIVHPGTKGIRPKTESGKQNKPNWIPDHQPPDELAKGGATLEFRFYPHSWPSARTQGGTVLAYKKKMKKLRNRDNSNWAEGVKSEWFW